MCVSGLVRFSSTRFEMKMMAELIFKFLLLFCSHSRWSSFASITYHYAVYGLHFVVDVCLFHVVFHLFICITSQCILFTCSDAPYQFKEHRQTMERILRFVHSFVHFVRHAFYGLFYMTVKPYSQVNIIHIYFWAVLCDMVVCIQWTNGKNLLFEWRFTKVKYDFNRTKHTFHAKW